MTLIVAPLRRSNSLQFLLFSSASHNCAVRPRPSTSYPSQLRSLSHTSRCRRHAGPKAVSNAALLPPQERPSQRSMKIAMKEKQSENTNDVQDRADEMGLIAPLFCRPPNSRLPAWGARFKERTKYEWTYWKNRFYDVVL
jgi:hypothetical protein